MTHQWEAAGIIIVGTTSIQKHSGHKFGDLGIWLAVDDIYSVTHLNSGLRVCLVQGNLPFVKQQVEQIHALADWSFGEPNGYQDTDPEMPVRLRAFAHASGGAVWIAGPSGVDSPMTREVASLRAAA